MNGYIKADILRKEYNDWYKLFLWGDGTDTEKATIARAIQILNEQPIADVVEVIRCEDCIHQRYCQQYILHKGFTVERRDLKYCSYGERRTDE